MAIPKEHRARHKSQTESMGLTAIGSSGPWQIDIDQTTCGSDRWFAQIEGPSMYMRFELPSLEIINQAIQLLSGIDGEARRNANTGKRNGTLTLGDKKTTQLTLLRDDEYADRYFLLVEPRNGPLIRLTLTGQDAMHLNNALCQVKQEIEAD